MPLPGGKKNIGRNIRELEHSQTKRGKQRSHKQNVAIALDVARKSGAHIPYAQEMHQSYMKGKEC